MLAHSTKRSPATSIQSPMVAAIAGRLDLLLVAALLTLAGAACSNSEVTLTQSCEGACNCTASAPLELAEGAIASSTLGLAVDSTGIYWEESQPARWSFEVPTGPYIAKLPLSGGAAVPLGPSAPLSSIAVGVTGVYWVNAPQSTGEWVCCTSAELFPLVKVGLDGGAPAILAETDGGPVVAPALNATDVYWAVAPYDEGTATAVYDGDAGVNAVVTVMRVGLDGGAAEVMASVPGLTGLAVDATSLYWTTEGEGGEFSEVGGVWRMPLSGGQPSELVSGRNEPQMLTVFGGNLYWTEFSATDEWGNALGSIMQMSVDGGGLVALASDQLWLSGLAVNSTGVYWLTNSGAAAYITDTTESALLRIGFGECEPQTLAQWQADDGDYVVPDVAVDATAVYWTYRPPGASPTQIAPERLMRVLIGAPH